MKFNPLKVLQCGFGVVPNDAPNEVSTTRRLLPQILASIPQYLLSWNLGLVLAFPSIVVPSVLGNSKNLNPDEILHMTPDEASWLASVSFIVQPIGNLLSGFIVDCIGRKWGIIVVNVVPVIAWILLPLATSQAVIVVGFALLGIGVGLTGSITYISEISEPSVRGVLMGIAGISTTSGMFLIWMLGTFLSWRQVAIASATIPILSIVLALFIPEAPIWLLSKNRVDEAQKSMQILRGWVSTESISAEFKQLQQINRMSSTCGECMKSNTKCTHVSPTLRNKFKDMLRKRSLKPFVLVVTAFAFMQFTAMFAMRPYIVPILSAFGILLDANLTTTIIGAIGVLANVVLTLFIRLLGKRRIYLWSNIGTFLTCFGLCIYGWVFFPSGWRSTDAGTSSNNGTEITNNSLESIRNAVGGYSYFALAMFLIMQFCVSIGVSSVPYQLLFEVFPFKSRAFYCGIAGALNQLFAFIGAKTYYDFERLFSLAGVSCFYGVISVCGFAVMTFMLPETEDRSLEDIELHFADNKRSIFSTYIQKSATNDTELNSAPKSQLQTNEIEAIGTNGETNGKQRF